MMNQNQAEQATLTRLFEQRLNPLALGLADPAGREQRRAGNRGVQSDDRHAVADP